MNILLIVYEGNGQLGWFLFICNTMQFSVSLPCQCSQFLLFQRLSREYFHHHYIFSLEWPSKPVCDNFTSSNWYDSMFTPKSILRIFANFVRVGFTSLVCYNNDDVTSQGRSWMFGGQRFHHFNDNNKKTWLLNINAYDLY